MITEKISSRNNKIYALLIFTFCLFILPRCVHETELQSCVSQRGSRPLLQSQSLCRLLLRISSCALKIFAHISPLSMKASGCRKHNCMVVLLPYWQMHLLAKNLLACSWQVQLENVHTVHIAQSTQNTQSDVLLKSFKPRALNTEMSGLPCALLCSQVVDCSWDETVKIYSVPRLAGAQPSAP